MHRLANLVVATLTSACMATALHADPVPFSGEVDWFAFRRNCVEVVATLDTLKSPLPPTVADRVKELLHAKPGDRAAQVVKVQKLLDPYCLVVITINAESRVKASRGLAPATLHRGRPVAMLVKILNDGGVTHPLRVQGPQLKGEGPKIPGRWLEARIFQKGKVQKHLSGQRIEYVLLQLTADEAGKREALLKFDAGQGTQDLGFRAEVPILFTIKTK